MSKKDTSISSINPADDVQEIQPVQASPVDAPAGSPQGEAVPPADQTPAVQTADAEGAGYALKVTRKGHVHAGQEVKKGATIALDVAEYRWALINKIGVPGKMEDVGKDVDSKGEVIANPDDMSVEQLEAAAIK
jgi:hypothetical protein